MKHLNTKLINSLSTMSSIFLLCTMLLSCSTENKQEDQSEELSGDEVILTAIQFKNAGIKTTSLVDRNITTVLKLNGKIDVPPQNNFSISIPLGGYLKSSSMLPGRAVSKGQIIAVIEDQQYIQLQQDYLITLTKLEYAEQEQNRQKELNKEKASSDKSLQQANTEFKSLRISAGALAEKLRLIGIEPSTLSENTISRQIYVRSPINGFVNKVNGNIGTYFNPSDILIELIDPSKIHLSLIAFEKDIQKLSLGQTAIAYSNINPGKKHKTKIELIARGLSTDGSAEIHCHFEKFDKSLTPGMYMNAEIALNDAQVKTLPEKSVLSFEGKEYVFVEIAKLNYKMVEVKTGEINEGYIEIKTDLGDQKIVSEGAYSLLMQLKNIED
jgi:cobalt-zinc-cadmium efflux system membrane fusion protein